MTSLGFVQKHADDPMLGAAAKTLGVAQEALGGSAMRMLTWFQTGKLAMVPLYANRFLEMMAETTVAWMLLEGAVIALEKKTAVAPGHPDAAFYEGKVAAALYYARNVLPEVELKARVDGRRGPQPARHLGRGVRDGLRSRKSGRRAMGEHLDGADPGR